jgi:hypothetical protein
VLFKAEDGQTQILDGWHRYQACETEGVEPEYEIYDGDDPAGLAVARPVDGQGCCHWNFPCDFARSMLARRSGIDRGDESRGDAHQR